jgi:hypothetical protein
MASRISILQNISQSLWNVIIFKLLICNLQSNKTLLNTEFSPWCPVWCQNHWNHLGFTLCLSKNYSTFFSASSCWSKYYKISCQPPLNSAVVYLSMSCRQTLFLFLFCFLVQLFVFMIYTFIYSSIYSLYCFFVNWVLASNYHWFQLLLDVTTLFFTTEKVVFIPVLWYTFMLIFFFFSCTRQLWDNVTECLYYIRALFFSVFSRISYILKLLNISC